MGSALNEFYTFLKTDLEIHRAESFLVRQMQKELLENKDTRDGSSAGGLAAAFDGAQRGPGGRRAYLLAALRLLQKDKKLALSRSVQKGMTGPLAKDLLLGYGRQMGCPGFEEGCAWNKARMVPALLDKLKAAPDAPPPEPLLVQTLHAELQEDLLLRRARDYIDNINRGRKNNREMRIFEAYLAERYGSGKDDTPTLERAARHSGAAAGRAPLTEEQIGQAETLFRALQKEEYARVMLPVELDPDTGAGLYFIGIKRLNWEEEREVVLENGPDDWCRLMICCPEEGLTPRLNDWDDVADKVDLVIWSDEQELFEELCGFPTVREGVTWLRKSLRERAGEVFLNEVERLPEGCPLLFERYFDSPEERKRREQERIAAVRELGRKAFREDAGEDSEGGCVTHPGRKPCI